MYCRHKMTLPERIRFKSEVASTGCWEWKGRVDKDGYGSIWTGKTMQLAHRASYECFRGQIPEGLELDHLCRNRRCCNPDHLEAVTHQQNLSRAMFRARGPNKVQNQKCRRGHDLSRSASGRRFCRTCNLLAVRRYAARRKEIHNV